MKDSNEQVKPGRDFDPVIEAYKKHIDVTLIRETCASPWTNASSS